MPGFARGGAASLKELCYFAGVTPAVVNALVTKGVVCYYEAEVYRNPYDQVQDPVVEKEIVLSEEQQTAFQNLLAQYRAGTGVSPCCSASQEAGRPQSSCA